ncbi:E3 ubiquitin-protein ligase At1g63170-like [Ipomoea triloba]|uniref:E3 ubiquitin-protein ligase At1g63170-like n=1 Tax=Ipomoea triloba TaxID=35885 RepID=UPI00125D6AA9|nr:E3 ubiquitin-protein ligase At1g63170-like [Ipomoea triloba]GMD22267.1 E3 ubiquitin-protein ligase At1g63170-like [Ipomoea batatas]
MSTARDPNEETSGADANSGSVDGGGGGDGGVDTTPLLNDQIFRSRRFMRNSPSLRGAARFLRRASSRRMMREPSMRVREAAAEQIEERQSDWAYSKPIVILDLIWNLAFIVVSISVLVMSREESPLMPLRLWIIGYACQCVLHMVCVFVEFRRRRSSPESLSSRRISGSRGWSSANSSSESDEETGDYAPERRQNEDEPSVAKHLESANTMFSFIWWIVGFYWVSAGGERLPHDSPQLYWLCITFLAFDVFFVVICVAVACVIGIAVCCCLPCIIAILYAVADQEGATKEDIEQLPKYKFRKLGDFEKQNGEIQESFGGVMTECDTDSPTEHVLPMEDAECCICLCSYDDGIELRELPCRHHFHCACIDKWLFINATCPLCKYNILKNGNQSGREDV